MQKLNIENPKKGSVKIDGPLKDLNKGLITCNDSLNSTSPESEQSKKNEANKLLGFRYV